MYYSNIDDATKCIDQLNFTKFYDNPWSKQPEFAVDKCGALCIYSKFNHFAKRKNECPVCQRRFTIFYVCPTRISGPTTVTNHITTWQFRTIPGHQRKYCNELC
eukprot:1009564_1